MKKLTFAVLVAVLLSWSFAPAKAADSYIMVPTTPDLSVSGLATADFIIDSITGRVDWVHIRNDCNTALYFDLNGGVQFEKSARTDQVYPIRLEGLAANDFTTRDTQIFQGPFRVKTLSVSNDTNNTCTFTFLGGRH